MLGIPDKRKGKRLVAKLHESRAAACKGLVGFLDLTTLEGTDDSRKIKALCDQAKRPLPGLKSAVSCAAVCVYPNWVAVAKQALWKSKIKVACVAGGFPSGQTFLKVKLHEVRMAVEAGADEVDVPINRGLVLSGFAEEAKQELVQIRQASRNAVLKVILETSELPSLDQVRLASRLALEAGAQFIKTSTGKAPLGATLVETQAMMEEIRAWFSKTGIQVGIKVSGGIRTFDIAWEYYLLTQKILGNSWLQPQFLRFGSSSLLNDLKKILI